MKNNSIEKIGILAIVVIIAVCGAYFYTAIQADSQALQKANAKKVATILEKVNNPTDRTVKFLTLDETHTLYNSGEALFMDARPEKDYNYMRIPGAMSAEYTRAKKIQDVLNLDRDRLIVVYCSSDTCPMAEILATRLDELMFSRVYIFAGGLKEWYNAKYPLERGSAHSTNAPDDSHADHQH
jgi:rhodanese-related sulfurtransferase